MSTDLPGSERLVLRRYLLGQLSPAEQDQVEEQFADPDYFAIYQSVERGLVQEYAGGTMAPLDADLFARNYLVTRTRRDQVAIAQALLEVRSDRWSVQPMQRASFPKWIPVLAMAASVVAAVVVVRHLRPARQALTASAQPVKPPAAYTSAPPEQPPPLHETPRAPAKATPSSKTVSSPTPEAVLPAAAEPTPAPPAESLPPIPVPEPPPSQPLISSSRALTAPTGTTPRSRPAPPTRPRTAAFARIAPASQAAPDPLPSVFKDVTLPTGTKITIRTIDPIDRGAADISHDYAARLDEPVVVNGVTVVPVNAQALLRLYGVGRQTAGKPLPPSLYLAAVTIEGQRALVLSGQAEGASSAQTEGTATVALPGAAGGASVATAGRAGGDDGVSARGKDLKIAPGTRFTFTLIGDSRVVVRNPRPSESPGAPVPSTGTATISIKLGMTIDEVVRRLGQPTTIVGDPSKKMIYIYTGLKLVFVDGKFTDIQ